MRTIPMSLYTQIETEFGRRVLGPIKRDCEGDGYVFIDEILDEEIRTFAKWLIDLYLEEGE